MSSTGQEPLLEAEDLEKEYRTGPEVLRVLRGASLTVRHGEFVTLVGASGVGKSTLLLAARELPRPVVRPVGQPHFRERGLGERARLVGRAPRDERGDHRVLERRQLAEQVVELEDEPDVLPPVADQLGLAAREQLSALEPHASAVGPVERA